MTNKEPITYKQALTWSRNLEDNIMFNDGEASSKTFALQALKLIQKALEKQIAKKPKDTYIGVETDAKSLCCPVCSYSDYIDLEDAQTDRKFEYCPMCGQKLERKRK